MSISLQDPSTRRAEPFGAAVSAFRRPIEARCGAWTIAQNDLTVNGPSCWQISLSAAVSHPALNHRRARTSSQSIVLDERMCAVRATDPVLTTRLSLTPVGAADVEDLVVLYGDPRVAFWTGPWTRGTIEAWAHGMAERWARDGVGKWMAHQRSDGTIVGRGGFSRIDLGGETVLELGWVVRDALTGLGYASEIGRAALEWAAVFAPQLPVVAFTEVHNAASRAVMRRIGMRDVGVIHREGLVAGRSGLHPDAPFSLYRVD